MIRRATIFLVLMASAWQGLLAADKPTIHWLSPDFPPVFIASGEYEGKGYGDQIVRYVAEKLPEYNHVTVTVNLNRIYAQMKKLDGFCSAALFRTPERTAFATFSDDVYHLMTNRVVVMQRNVGLFAPFLNTDGEIDIAKLVAADHLSLGVVPERFYSQLINETLGKLGAADHMVTIPFDRYGALLLHGRIDYTFGFPAEVNHQFRQLGKPDSFTAFPIAGEESVQSGGFSCSDMPIGRALIGKINAMIAKEDLSGVYDSFYEQWLDARSLKDYRKRRAAMKR
ncbi:TIGR02285 family protein [Kordiimonas lipolytica]|uniref:TIGR02285 family protein n=1 Tax=Kordiimonas lipolytica TaxID=1662421 RepID=A0ABV8UBS1_9PROT|nr:TIGR02285 family protein [Kordiimonas lipolytica]